MLYVLASKFDGSNGNKSGNGFEDAFTRFSGGLSRGKAMRKRSEGPVDLMGDRIVNGQTIRALFVPPIGKTKLHELVNEGKVVRASTGKGKFLLHATCRNLGLDAPPLLNAAAGHSQEEVIRWAFSMIDPLVFPIPGWAIENGSEDLPRAELYAEFFGPTVTNLEPAPLKLAFLAGLIDSLNDGMVNLDYEAMRTRLKDGPVVISIDDLDRWLQRTEFTQLDKDE